MAALPKTAPKSEPPADTKEIQDDASQAGEPATVEAGSGGKRKLLIIGGIVLAVLGLGGGAAFYFLHSAPTAASAEEASAVPAHKVAIYLNLRPDFIVNSTAVGQRRYLQTNVVIMARDQLVIDAVNTHAPIIRSAIVNLLADQDFMVLQTDAGKQALREQMRVAVDTALKKEGNLSGVEAILFNSFVMQ